MQVQISTCPSLAGLAGQPTPRRTTCARHGGACLPRARCVRPGAQRAASLSRPRRLGIARRPLSVNELVTATLGDDVTLLPVPLAPAGPQWAPSRSPQLCGHVTDRGPGVATFFRALTPSWRPSVLFREDVFAPSNSTSRCALTQTIRSSALGQSAGAGVSGHRARELC